MSLSTNDMIVYAEHLISLLKILCQISLYIRYNSESLKCPLNTPHLLSRCIHAILSLAHFVLVSLTVIPLGLQACSSFYLKSFPCPTLFLPESHSFSRALVEVAFLFHAGSAVETLALTCGHLKPYSSASRLSLKLWDLLNQRNLGWGEQQAIIGRWKSDGKMSSLSTEGRQF